MSGAEAALCLHFAQNAFDGELQLLKTRGGGGQGRKAARVLFVGGVEGGDSCEHVLDGDAKRGELTGEVILDGVGWCPSLRDARGLFAGGGGREAGVRLGHGVLLSASLA